MALPWLIQALGRFAGLGGRAAGRKPWRPKWDYDPPAQGGPRPVWQRPGQNYPPKGGQFDWTKHKPSSNEPGWINRLYMNPTAWQGKALRMGSLGLGGSIAYDRLLAGGRREGKPFKWRPLLESA